MAKQSIVAAHDPRLFTVSLLSDTNGKSGEDVGQSANASPTTLFFAQSLDRANPKILPGQDGPHKYSGLGALLPSLGLFSHASPPILADCPAARNVMRCGAHGRARRELGAQRAPRGSRPLARTPVKIHVTAP